MQVKKKILLLMCCNRICSPCLPSIKQILCTVDLYGTKPNFNDCDIAHVYSEDTDSAKQLNIRSLSPNGSLVLVIGLK